MWPRVDRHFFRDSAWQTCFGKVIAMGMTFDVQCNPQQMGEFAEMLRNVPGGTEAHLIVDHLGLPQLRDMHDSAGLTAWRQGLQTLARFPNTFLKLSMLTHAFARGAEKWWDSRPGEDFVRQQLLDEAIHMFGSTRCMWATNWPVDIMLMTPKQTLQFFVDSSAHLDDNSRRSLFAGSCRRAYRLE